MKNPFLPGDWKIIEKLVTPEDLASFEGKLLHPVYSTYAMARDAEWAGRQFVLDMLEEGEEGIGTFVHLDHHAPAPNGSLLKIIAIFEELKGNHISCRIEVKLNELLIGSGRTGQKILRLEKINGLFNR
jgi:predicted thioesterase